MNFDNNRLPYSLSLKDPTKFVVSVSGAPSFGVNKNGMFINHLMVDSNGEGNYRRGKNVVHTIKLISDVLDGKLTGADLTAFLDNKVVVNVPNNSCHCLISDARGDVWIVEPGRGIIISAAEESPFFAMTNFSLCDCKNSDEVTGGGVDRYRKADQLLSKTEMLDVAGAFEILKATAQSGPEWYTEFSMVYNPSNKIIYYCKNAAFDVIHEHHLN